MTATVKISKQETFVACESDHEIARCNRIINDPKSTEEDVRIAVERITLFREMLDNATGWGPVA